MHFQRKIFFAKGRCKRKTFKNITVCKVFINIYVFDVKQNNFH